MLKIFLTNLLFISYLFAIEKGEFYGSAQEKNPSWFKSSFLDLEEDINDATKKGKNIIIYFHQNGCPYCAKLIRDNFYNPALVKKIKQNFEVIEINMFGDRELTDWNGKEFNEKTFAEHLKIQFTPSLLFLNPEKQIVLRLNGYQSTKKMHQVLDYLISKKYKTQTFANYKYNNKKTTGKLITEPFFEQAPFILSRNKKHPASQPLAVFFEQPNCADCVRFHKNILQLKQVKKYFQQMEVIQLNSNADTGLIKPNNKRTTAKKWYSDLALTYTPAIVFFDEYGQEIIRKDAFFQTFHFQSILSYILDKAYLKQPSFQRYIEEKSDKIRNKGKDVNIWE